MADVLPSQLLDFIGDSYDHYKIKISVKQKIATVNKWSHIRSK